MDLTQLKHSRTSRRNLINKLVADARQAIVDNDQLLVESCLEKLQCKEIALKDVNEKLEVQAPVADLAVEIANNDLFSDFIIDAKIDCNRFIKHAIAAGQVAAAAAVVHFPVPAQMKNAKLPKLQIGKFDGTITDWERFWDQFSAGIDTNNTLAKVDKFNYLKGFLKDSASLTIAGLSLTDANYDIAIQLLQEKYGDKQVLIAEHIKQLWELKRVTRLDNGADLRQLVENFQKHIRALELLGQNVTDMGALLCPILLKCLPNPIVREWHRKNKGVAIYNLLLLVSFVKEELKGIELTYSSSQLREPSSSSTEVVRKRDNRVQSFTSSTSAMLATEESNSSSNQASRAYKPYCVFCNEANTHTSTNCTKYVSNQDRRSSLAASHRCFHCLKKSKDNHMARACTQQVVCRLCHQKSHHTLLCLKRNDSATTMPVSSSVNRRGSDLPKPIVKQDTHQEASAYQSALVATSASIQSRTAKNVSVLQTVRVWIQHEGETQEVIALIDNGSERSFITSRIVKRLNLPSSGEENNLIRSFGGGQTQQKSQVIPFTLMGSNGVKLSVTALQVNEICQGVKLWETSLIERFLQEKRVHSWNQMMGPGEAVKIDLLIGADQYWRIMTGHMKRLNSSLMATQSIFGWLLQGSASMHGNLQSAVTAMFVSTQMEENYKLNSKLASLWELDSSGVMKLEESCQQTLQDIEVLDNYHKTTTYQDNRYQVRIPWNEYKSELSNNFDVTLERLRKLLWKLQRDPVLFERYRTTLFEYLKNGHAEEVELNKFSQVVYYMPHQAIIREDRITTKTRIVFDASSSPENGFSLNKCQFAGPNLNPLIFDLLLRFRWHRVAMTTDLSKAFLQVVMHPDDRDANRFLWAEAPWKKGTQPQLRVFRMTRVLFGMKSSPFLLAATIRHHVRTQSGDEELTLHVHQRTYVDDFLSGDETTMKAHTRSIRVYELMLKGGMQFSKWATNDVELRKMWVTDGLVPAEESIEHVKVLGLYWNTVADKLCFHTTELLKAASTDPCTKRSMLEILARIFDPLGFFTPVVVTIKKLLQDLWQLKVDWDAEIPNNILAIWSKWKEDLLLMEEFRIPRWLGVSSLESFQLHTFVDAGPRVYGCISYFRFQSTEDAAFQTCFVSAKSRVAPVQPMSIPRLELMACLIGSRLSSNICKALSCKKIEQILWSDSKVALSWIRDVPSRWKVFVARRVQEIQNNTANNCTWKYVSSKQNIADVITRGQSLKLLLKNEDWWNGPQWLKTLEEDRENSEFQLQENDESSFLQEEQIITSMVQFVCIEPIIEEVTKFSTWRRLIRVTAWLMRFCNNCRKKEKELTSWLTFPEVTAAELYWISCIQHQQFSKELRSLQLQEEVPKDSCLFQFKPFLDEKQVIRLGGRLKWATVPFAQKHPFLLKGSTSSGVKKGITETENLVEKFIQDRHVKTLHGGVQTTLAEIRKHAWILRGRQVVRKAIKGCMSCRRWNAKPATEEEAPLPLERVAESNCFHTTGIDFFGPIYAKDHEEIKPVYGCLFTCAVTRAVHLELVASQNTKCFVLAFRRFFARRGGCKICYSDNAQAYRKVDRLLRESYALLTQTQTQEEVTKLGIEWKFIASRAAWWGGFYERMIQISKYHLKRILGAALLSMDELSTVLTEIEAVVNNRPLSPISEDFADGEYLTPAHFLLGRTGNCLTDSLLHFTDIPTGPQLRRRWRYRNQLMNRFWKRWRHDYLLQLRTAHSVKRSTLNQEPVQLNDVVLLIEDKLPRGKWAMARVAELTKGRDDRVRSVLLQTANGNLLRRAVQHICPLEIM